MGVHEFVRDSAGLRVLVTTRYPSCVPSKQTFASLCTSGAQRPRRLPGGLLKVTRPKVPVSLSRSAR